jgi:pimeloyl-ACP methyl ester carboxylesterase
MILHGAFSSLRDVATEILPATRWVPDVFFFRPRMDNCARLRNLDPEIPVLILHGAYDEIFATRHAERLLQASASYDKNLVVLKGCMHMQTDSAHLSAVTALVGELQRLSEGSD